MPHAQMQPADGQSDLSMASLTPRESELLRKAGERVFALSRRLASSEQTAEQLRSESKSLRDLLAESREVRAVLSAQVASMQTELDREYEERAELRRLLASLHLQMQELLPVVTGLSRMTPQLAQQAPEVPSPEPARDATPAPQPRQQTFSQRFLSAAQDEFRGFRKGQRRR